MSWLYEPKGGKEEYPLPIHSEDNMLTGFSFQSIIDSFNASVNEKTEKNLKLFIQETVRITLDDMWDNYDLTREMLLKECGIEGSE